MAHDKEGDCSTNSATALEVVLSGLNNFYWGVSLISRYYRPDNSVSNAALYLGCILSLTAVPSAYLRRKVNLSHQPDARGSFLPDYETFPPVEEHKRSSLSCPQKMALVASVSTYAGDVNGGFFVGIDLITNMASVALSLWVEIPLHVMVIALGLASAYASVRTSRHAILGEESVEAIRNPAASEQALVESGADKWTNIAAASKGMSKIFSSFYLGISLFYDPAQEGVTSDGAAISVGCFFVILAIFSVYAERSLNIYHQGNHKAPPLSLADSVQPEPAVEYTKEKLTTFQKLSLGSFALTTAGACGGLVTAVTDIVTKKAFQTVLPQGIKDAIKGGVFLFGLFGSYANLRSCRDAMTQEVAVPVLPSERNSVNSLLGATKS